MSDTTAVNAEGPKLVSPLSASLGFAQAITDVARSAVQRELAHRLPHEEVARLKELGLGALRLPVEAGGRGLSLSELFVVARDLAAADSNVAHVFRNHLWQVEAALRQPGHPLHAHVLALTKQKKTIGLGFAESDATAAGAPPSAVLSRLEWDAGRNAYVGSGEKVYATGNFHSDAFVGLAVESREGRTVQYLFERGEGVSNDDDWPGFGQRLTGSGTAKFHAVTVNAGQVYPPDPPARDGAGAAPWRYTFHQAYLTNCIAGIVRRVALDALDVLRTRRRNFYHGLAGHPGGEPVLQGLLGRIRAYAASVEATADRAIAALQRAWDSYGTPAEYDAALAATLSAAEAKVVIDDLAPQIASWLIDLGSASVVSRPGGLDRHWRNIKVVASHNPRLYKEVLLGQNLLTGVLPPTGAFF